jgi:hypothetical protein
MKQKTPTPEPTGKVSDAEAIKRLFTFGSFGLGAVFAKSANELPAGERHLINALRLFYSYRHNGFLLGEALDICTRHNVNPPAWVLVALNEGLQKFNKGYVSLERSLGFTKRHKEEYKQYREEHAVMGKVRELINADSRRRISPACRTVANRNGLIPDTLEKKYRRFWKGFFDFVRGKA